jgi:hypothetical protein
MKTNLSGTLALALIILPGLLAFTSCASIQRSSLFSGTDKRAAPEEIAVIGSVDEFFLHTDYLIRQGQYQKAFHRAQRIYEESDNETVREEALFRMAVLLSYGENPKRDKKTSEKLAAKFLKDYPGSRRTFETNAVRLLLQEIRRDEAEIDTLKQYNATQDQKIQGLEEDLRKIKEIDLQLEEQKKKLE